MNLHSIKLGKGTPLVILHGFLGMADNWKTLGKQWSEHGYEVHILDQRNHGRSPHSAEFSYELMSLDLKNYCAQHNLSDIYLIGHSMGGKVAMQAASMFPQLIKKMVIADIAPKTYPPHHSDIINALQAVDFTKIERRNQANEVLATRIKDEGTRQFLLKSLYRKEGNTFGWRFHLDVLAHCQEMIGKHQEFQRTIDTPTLFLRGGDSGYILDQDMMIIDNAFAKAELKTIPDAGHWLHAQQPKLFFVEVDTFFSKS